MRPLLALGAPANPPRAAEAGHGPCMFDPLDPTWRYCAHASQGRCHHYATTCEPDCMFGPSDATYKECAHASQGHCHHDTTTYEP